MHTFSPDKPKKFKQMLFAARNLMATDLWDRKGMMVVIRSHNLRNVLRSAKGNWGGSAI
jgi:hypothetical protein